MIRNNKQIQRLAEYLHEEVRKSDYHVSWKYQPQGYKDYMYDKALGLNYALIQGLFTGPEGHKD